MGITVAYQAPITRNYILGGSPPLEVVVESLRGQYNLPNLELPEFKDPKFEFQMPPVEGVTATLLCDTWDDEGPRVVKARAKSKSSQALEKFRDMLKNTLGGERLTAIVS